MHNLKVGNLTRFLSTFFFHIALTRPLPREKAPFPACKRSVNKISLSLGRSRDVQWVEGDVGVTVTNSSAAGHLTGNGLYLNGRACVLAKGVL